MVEEFLSESTTEVPSTVIILIFVTMSSSPWSSILFEDFVAKELTKKLEWRDIVSLRLVNKEWNSIFTSDKIWKQINEYEHPFDSSDSETYFKRFSNMYKKTHGIVITNTIINFQRRFQLRSYKRF